MDHFSVFLNRPTDEPEAKDIEASDTGTKTQHSMDTAFDNVLGAPNELRNTMDRNKNEADRQLETQKKSTEIAAVVAMGRYRCARGKASGTTI